MLSDSSPILPASRNETGDVVLRKLILCTRVYATILWDFLISTGDATGALWAIELHEKAMELHVKPMGLQWIYTGIFHGDFMANQVVHVYHGMFP